MSEKSFETMPVDVFEGAGGHLVLCQELPSLAGGEEYIRIMVPMDAAEELAQRILAVCKLRRMRSL
ncbi:hypothetical protein [Bradyrhizobium sp.]|uniref:hypothetical protein n=1 Tax=Bradyrhizobium sp. TaxID=376 RepID=UPI003C4F27A1